MTPLNPEKINFIISIAREYREGSLAMISEELSETHTSDSYTEHSLATIVEKQKPEEHAQDSAYNGLMGAIDTLNEEEKYALVALMWVGRGTFDPEEFDKAVVNARRSGQEHTAEYLIDTPLLPDYLEEGLVQLGDN